MPLLDGRAAIVTGAGRGLGREEALALAAEGARVIVNDVGASLAGDGEDRSPAASVVEEIHKAGGEAIACFEDISTWDGAARAVALAWDRFGQLDILVNNAGVLRDRMSFNMTEEEFDLVMSVHCKGHFAMTRHACARWREAGKATGSVYGRIINTASEAGLIGSAGNSNYAMAKAAIAALTVSIAREMGKYGVTSNFIAPRARTRMTLSMPNHAMFDEPEGDAFDVFHPAWPAQLVVFLASEAAGDLNGQGFVVWGGEVQLVHGWHGVGQIASPGAALMARDLIARKDELFRDRPRQPTFM
jgi:NAD(P)-dependent dehydrogenase (short-subunit alcohol dehydrogenase family)